MRSLALKTAFAFLMTAGLAFAADPPKVGDVVWAQWKPNQWYHGKLDKKTDLGFHVAFDDGDKSDLPVSFLALDNAPKKADLKPGVRVTVPQAGGPLQHTT